MPVYKTGVTPLSFTQQFLLADPTKFVVNGRLFFYEAALTTPVNGYSDANAQFLLSNPLQIGADGRIPAIYFVMADDSAVPGTFVTRRTSVRMRLLDKNGVIQFDYAVVPLMTSDPSSGGGGPAPTPVDPLGLMTTGMMMSKYGVGKIPGFVRANGLTIGKTSSTATEMNDDLLANALYLHLYGADTSLDVSGGRTGNAAADFAAGKTLALPDFSGCTMAGLDNMSDTVRNVLTAQVFNVPGRGPTVLGATAGTERHQLAIPEMPVHDHAAFINDPGHTHPTDANKLPAGTPGLGAGAVLLVQPATITSAQTGVRVKSTSAGGVDDKVAAAGQGQLHLNLQPTKLVTVYIRL